MDFRVTHEIAQRARHYAEMQSITLSRALSCLVERGLALSALDRARARAAVSWLPDYLARSQPENYDMDRLMEIRALLESAMATVA